MDGDRFCLADGTQLTDSDFPRVVGPEYPGINGITRPRLHEILTGAVKRSGAEVTLGHRLKALEQTPDGVDIELTDGSSGRYDMVIGADGVFSQVRSLVFPERLEPRYSGQAVWRYNLPRPAEVNKLTMYAGPESKAGMVPLAPDLMYLLYIETPGGETPPHIDPDTLAEELRVAPYAVRRQDRRGTGPDHRLEQGRLPPDRDRLGEPPWQRGRVTLLGDAAHATSPHVGQGAAMALEDSVVLAEELAADRTIYRRRSRRSAVAGMSVCGRSSRSPSRSRSGRSSATARRTSSV